MASKMTPERAARLVTLQAARQPVENTEALQAKEQGINAVQWMVTNNYISAQRADMLRRMFDPRRDVNEECGYLPVIGEQQYRLMYDREMGRRVVNVYPEETWKRLPRIFENPDPDVTTPFEESLDAVEQRHHLLHYLQRADELSGVGHYGIILWGLDDGKTLDQPVQGWEQWEEATGGNAATGTQQAEPAAPTRKLLYIRCLDESLIKIVQYERDVANPRYGLPLFYLITLTDFNLHDTTSLTPPTDLVQMRIHWTRVTHVADNRKTSEVMGTPRQEPVWNRLCDLRKVLGGSGEMFWKGGFPGISLETQTGYENANLDIEKTRQMMADYMNGLQRYLALTGMNAKSLAPQIADPASTFDVQIKAICVVLGVPYRVFMGIEEGVVSGDQATEAWAGRLMNRQTRYVTPMLINVVIQRLIDYGVLAATAKPRGWQVEWPDLMEMSADDKAGTAVKRTQAFAQYVSAGVDVLVPPMEYLTTVHGFTEKEAKAITAAATAHITDVQEHNQDDTGNGPPVPGREPKAPVPPPEPPAPVKIKPGEKLVPGVPPGQKTAPQPQQTAKNGPPKAPKTPKA